MAPADTSAEQQRGVDHVAYGELVHIPADPLDTAAPRRRRRWWWWALLAVLFAVAGGGWLVGQRVRSADQAAAQAEPPTPSWITAPVERRVLAQTVIGRGQVSPEQSIAIGVPASVEGTPVITAVSAAVGDEVVEGTRLVEVSGRPVFVLAGEVPVYRPLRPGMAGADVGQLQAALTRAGCDTTGDGDVYGAQTKLCVAWLYLEAGYEPAPSTTTEAADIAAAEQAVADAQAGVETAHLALDQAGRGATDTERLGALTALVAAQRAYNDAVASSDAAVGLADGEVARASDELDRVYAGPEATATEVAAAEAALAAAHSAADQARRDRGSNIANAADNVTLAEAALDELSVPADVTAEQGAVDQAIALRDHAQSALDALRASTGPMVPEGEVVFAPTLPARVQQAVTTLGPLVAGSSDDATAPGSASLMTLASGELVVTMMSRPGEDGLLRVDMPVELLEEQTNTGYPGTIRAVSATQTRSADGQAGFPVTITSDARLPDSLSGANLRVTITAASTETEALVVPLAAVSSSADGSTSVSVLPSDTEAESDPIAVAVVTGISADGFVVVEPVSRTALSDGDRVVVGR